MYLLISLLERTHVAKHDGLRKTEEKQKSVINFKEFPLMFSNQRKNYKKTRNFEWNFIILNLLINQDEQK